MTGHRPVWFGAANYAGPVLCLGRVKAHDDDRRRRHYCGRPRWHDGPCACVCRPELVAELDAPTPADVELGHPPPPPAPTPPSSGRTRALAELAAARASIAKAREGR